MNHKFAHENHRRQDKVAKPDYREEFRYNRPKKPKKQKAKPRPQMEVVRKTRRLGFGLSVTRSLQPHGCSLARIINAINSDLGRLNSFGLSQKSGDDLIKKPIALRFDAWATEIDGIEETHGAFGVEVPVKFEWWLNKFKGDTKRGLSPEDRSANYEI